MFKMYFNGKKSNFAICFSSSIHANAHIQTAASVYQVNGIQMSSKTAFANKILHAKQ